jgi:hypothetical protein
MRRITMMSNTGKYVNDVISFEIYTSGIGRYLFMLATSSSEAKRRLDVFMKEVFFYNKEEYNATIYSTIPIPELMGRFMDVDTKKYNNDEETGE